MIVKVKNALTRYRRKQDLEEAEKLANYLSYPHKEEIDTLLKRKEALDYTLSGTELSGQAPSEDSKGLLRHIDTHASLPVVSIKKKAQARPTIDPGLSKLVIWFLGCAAFWLVFGTTVGIRSAIKFVAPDADQLSWLSFGRLRPVHTNAVFWGRSSLGMLGLGYYIVPRVSNAPLKSLKLGWYTLYLINASVIIGSICLMAGINNGGGEYREYIWPVMLLFGIGLALTLISFADDCPADHQRDLYIQLVYGYFCDLRYNNCHCSLCAALAGQIR